MHQKKATQKVWLLLCCLTLVYKRAPVTWLLWSRCPHIQGVKHSWACCCSPFLNTVLTFIHTASDIGWIFHTNRLTAWHSHHTDKCITQLILHALFGNAESQWRAKLALLKKKYVLSPRFPSSTPPCLTVGGPGECVWFNTSHGQDKGVQCELEFSRPAQRGGAWRDQRQTRWVCKIYKFFRNKHFELIALDWMHSLFLSTQIFII